MSATIDALVKRLRTASGQSDAPSNRGANTAQRATGGNASSSKKNSFSLSKNTYDRYENEYNSWQQTGKYSADFDKWKNDDELDIWRTIRDTKIKGGKSALIDDTYYAMDQGAYDKYDKEYNSWKQTGNYSKDFQSWYDEGDRNTFAALRDYDIEVANGTRPSENVRSFIDSLDKDVLDRVAKDYLESQVYDLTDPEDLERQKQGLPSKASDKYYDMNDEMDRYMYRHGIPSNKSNFLSKKYAAAEEKVNKENEKNTATAQGILDRVRAFQDTYSQFAADFADASAAKLRETGAAALVGEDKEDVLLSLMQSGKYDTIMDYFGESDEEPDTPSKYASAAKKKAPLENQAVYDAAYDAILRGEMPGKEFFDVYKESDFDKYLARKLDFDGGQIQSDAGEMARGVKEAALAENHAAGEMLPSAADLVGNDDQLNAWLQQQGLPGNARAEAIDGKIAEIDEQLKSMGVDKSGIEATYQPTEEELNAIYQEAMLTGESADTLIQRRNDEIFARVQELNRQKADLENSKKVAQSQSELLHMTEEAKKSAGFPATAPRLLENPEGGVAKADDSVFLEITDGWHEKAKAIFKGVNGVGDTDFVSNVKMYTVGGELDYLLDPGYAAYKMTDDERRVFNYYARNVGEKQAIKYYNALLPTLNARVSADNYETEVTNVANLARENPVVASIGGTVLQGQNALEGYAVGLQGIGGTPITKNDPRMKSNRMSGYARSVVSEDISPTGQLFYQTGMSMVDNIARLPMGKAGLAAMAGQVLASRANELIEAGATSEQAIAGGFASAAIEVLTEYVSLDKILNPKLAGSAKGIIIEALKQGGIESSEEAASEILNLLYDTANRQDDSEWRTKIAQYVESGYSPEKAEIAAFWDSAKQVFTAALGGFISGGAMGTGSQFIGNLAQGIDFDGSVSIGKKLENGMALSQAYNDAIASGGKALTADAQRSIAVDLGTIGLEKYTVSNLTKLTDQMAQFPQMWMTEQGKAVVGKFSQIVTQKAADIRSRGAAFSEAQTKALTRLNSLYQAVAAAQESANEAKASGDVNAYAKAVGNFRSAMQTYQDAVTNTKAEMNTKKVKAEAADQKDRSAVVEAGEALQAQLPMEQEAQLAAVTATIEERIPAQLRWRMKGMAQAIDQATENGPAEAAEAAKAANTRNRESVHDVNPRTIDLAIREAEYNGDRDAVNKLRAYKRLVEQNVPLQATMHETREALNLIDRLLNPSTEGIGENDGPAQRDLMDYMVNGDDDGVNRNYLRDHPNGGTMDSDIDPIDYIVNGGKTDGGEGRQITGENGGRSETRTDGVYDGESGRDDIGTAQRTDAGGFRGSSTDKGSGNAQDTGTRQVAAIDRWDVSSAKPKIAGVVAAYNSEHNGGSPKLADGDITASDKPSNERVRSALETANKYLGGQKPLLFNVREGVHAIFGWAEGGREYVRDTGDDLVAFYFFHEGAHNREYVRVAARAVLDMFGGNESSMFQRYIDRFNEHPRTKVDWDKLSTEFLCDVFGAYGYSKATGKDIASRLGLTESEARSFYSAFEDAMSAPALEDSEDRVMAGDIKISQVKDVSSGIQFTEHDVGDDREITQEQLDGLRTIPEGTNLRDLSSDQLKKSELFARVLWSDLREKSPFFNSWFGDWRKHDRSPIKAASVKRDLPHKAGRAVNADTNRVFSWGHDFFMETKNHLRSGGIANDISGSVKDLVENAVLFDTAISGNRSASKLPGTAFMHHLYAIADDHGELSLMKLYAEEAIPKNGGAPFIRAYELKDIKKVTALPDSVLLRIEGLTDESAVTIDNVSKLYAVVKALDPEFKATKPVSLALLDERGRPKKLYHGTKQYFTIFKPDYRGAIWLTDNANIAEGFSGNGDNANVMPLYARAENPLVMTVGFDENWDIDRAVEGAKAGSHDGLIVKFANADLRNNSYYRFMLANYPSKPASEVFNTVRNAPPAEIAGDMTIAEFDASLGADGKTHEYVAVFDPTQVKSATDNIGTYDRQNPDIDFSSHDLGASDDTTPSRQSEALNLYDSGESIQGYWEKHRDNWAPENTKVLKELRGIMLRNGQAVGGALGQQELDTMTENSARWKQIPRMVQNLTSPGRLFEKLGAWRTGKVASDTAENYVEGKRMREKYFDFGQNQMANKALWMREEGEKVRQAFGKGDIRISTMSQLMGEQLISRDEAENALYDKDHLIVQKGNGVFVFDKHGQLTVLSDGDQTVILDENYRKRMKDADREIKFIQTDPKLNDRERSKAIADLTRNTKAMAPLRNMPVKVTRDGRNVTVTDANGHVIASVNQGKKVDVDHVARVTDALKDFYARAYDVQNTVLMENGYKPLGHIKDYFPHQGRADTGITAFIKMLNGESESLPTSISGLTSTFKPGKPWAAHVLERMGTFTEYDAIRGFNKYLGAAGDVIYSTPVVQRIRQLESKLRNAEPVSGPLSATTNSALVSWLRNYGNIFANKKSDMDRGAEDQFGRGMYSVSNKLTGLISASAIGANPRSALSNVISFLNSVPTLETKQIVPALAGTVRNMIAGADNNDGFSDMIPFLASRQNSYKAIQTNALGRVKQTGSDVLYWMFETMDRITSESTARAKYAELREKGFSEEQAAQKTSAYCLDMYADRTKGANATLFNSKLLKPFIQFQMEVLNQTSHFRDVRQIGIGEQIDKIMLENGGTLDGIDLAEIGREVHADGAKDIGRVIAYLLLMSLWGGFTRWAWGDDQTWNPVGMASDAVRNYKDGGIMAALTGIGESVVNQAPFASTLTGGRIPIAAGVENITDAVKNIIAGNTDAAGTNLLKGALSITPGGGQANRMIQGAKAAKQGGNFTGSGKMRYPIETTGDKARAVLFGPSAAAPNGYKWGEEVLTAKETEAYQAARDKGVEDFDLYDYLVNGYSSSDTKAEQLLSLAAADPPKDEVDVIAEVLGLNYKGNLKKAAIKEAKQYKKRKDPDPDTIARIDEMLAIIMGS